MTVTDTGTPSISGSLPVSVTPGAATHFALTAPATAQADVSFPFMVTALDQFNNRATGYTGTIHFSSTDPNPLQILPGNATLTAGTGNFSITLATVGNQTVTVTDAANSLTQSSTITVNPGVITKFAPTGTPVATDPAGTTFNFVVTAQDADGNTVPSYTGPVHFSSTDTGASTSLPPNSLLTNGVGTFSATLTTAGVQAITVADASNGSILGTSSVIDVVAINAVNLSETVPADVTAGVPFTVTVALTDEYGNPATGYVGTVHFVSTDPGGDAARQLHLWAWRRRNAPVHRHAQDAGRPYPGDQRYRK